MIGDQPGDRMRVFFPHPLGVRTTQWERGNDPLTRFSFTDKYSRYGLATSAIDVAVPRRRDCIEKLSPTGSRPERYLATHTKTNYAERDDNHSYIVDRVARSTVFEVENEGRDDIFTLKHEIARGKYDKADKVIGQTINYYDGDPNDVLGAAYVGLPFRKVGSYGAVTRSETLVLTPRILADAYKSGDAVQSPPELPPYFAVSASILASDYPNEFRQLLGALAGYVHYDGSDDIHAEGYFAVSSRARFDFHDGAIANPKGLMLTARDALGADTTIEYDRFGFLALKVTDAVGLTTEAAYGDYRVFQPRSVTDPNGNRSLFGFTPLGLLDSTFVRGKAVKEGDWSRPGMRLVYGFLAYYESPPEARQPVSVRTIQHVHHDTDLHVSQAARDETIESVEYIDGFGRLLQTRAQAEDVLFGTPPFGSDIIPADQGALPTSSVGSARDAADPENVVVSGWQTYDNKGNIVEKFEPFFERGWNYALPRPGHFGAKTRMFYDPRGQVIRAVNADGSEQRVVYGVPGSVAGPDLTNPRIFEPTPWETYTYDANDNAGRTHAGDPRAGTYEHHWNTPSSIVIDALGRTIEAVARNRNRTSGGSAPAIEEIRTTSTYDLHGNLVTVKDALGRQAFRYVYDLGKRPWRIESIDAGRRRTVYSATGQVIEQRDGKGALILHGYDRLGRPSRIWARDVGHEPITLRERLSYGDGGTVGQPASERASNAAFNRLGRVAQHYDEAGLVSFRRYEFKGGVLEKVRQVIRDGTILSVLNAVVRPFRADWNALNDSALDATVYETSTRYDALNRVSTLVYPRDVENKRRELRRTYNRAGALESIELEGERFVERIGYDAKGQRTLVVYGNGVMTRYVYDAKTFRLARLRTEKFSNTGVAGYQGTGTAIQDFGYEYDLVGNIIAIHDRTPGSGIPNSLAGLNALDRRFNYDALYRLTNATGREADFPPLFPWDTASRSADVTRARAYSESYEYDKVGNMETLKHLAGGGGFTRNFVHEAGSNRLMQMRLNATPFEYERDENGNVAQETASRHFEWDHRDRLRAFRSQAAGSAATLYAQYLYDGAGERVKKVVRNAGGQIFSATYIDATFEHTFSYSGLVVSQTSTVHISDHGRRAALIRLGDLLPDGPRVQYQLPDHLGSCNVVIGGANSEASAFINGEEYSPFGETTFTRVRRERFAFTGKEQDEESGFYYFGLRYYAPWIARWASPDPAAQVYGPNAYGYVEGRAMTQIDRLGLNGEDPFPADPSKELAKSLNAIASGPPELARRLLDKALAGWNAFRKRATELAFDREAYERAKAANLPMVEPNAGLALTGEIVTRTPQASGDLFLIMAGGMRKPVKGTRPGAPHSGVEQRSTPQSSAPNMRTHAPMETVAAELFRLRDGAVADAWTRVMSSPELAERMTPTRFGNLVDEIFKDAVDGAIADSRLPASFRVTPTSNRGPAYGIDVWDSATGQGYDVHPANTRQVIKHMNSYQNATMPDGTVITNVNPLVYESPWRQANSSSTSH